jgi:hypothetical protein
MNDNGEWKCLYTAYYISIFMEFVRIAATITPNDKQWLKDNSINVSLFLRNAIKEKQEMNKNETRGIFKQKV